MSISASTRARAFGITTEYSDLRSGQVLYLPQHLAIIAQATTEGTPSTTKFTATTAAQVGTAAGYRSPAYLIARELFPTNGDGVGSIEVDFLLLDDAGGAAAAAGSITPSGTATAAGTYYARIGGYLSEAFTIAAGAIDVSAVCHDLGQAIQDVLHLPAVATWTYGALSETHAGNTGTGTLTSMTAAATTIPGAWVLTCTSKVTNGGVFSLTDPDGTEVADDLTITPGPGGTCVFSESGLGGTITDGSTDFEVDDAFTITVPAATVVLTAPWKGESGNDIVVEIVDATGQAPALGVTFAIVQPTGGATDPSVVAALAQLGPSTWYTMGLCSLNLTNSTAWNLIQTWGEGRWGELVHKPCVFFCGNTAAAKADAVVTTETRTTDRIASQLVAPGSPNLPCVVAARQLARIAVMANNTPSHDYGSLQATGLLPGTDAQQWDHPTRDAALKDGCSTIEVRDGVVCISDVVTMYAPSGDTDPCYRYVCDIVKLQQCIYNTAAIFDTTEWDGAALIPDSQATTEPTARKPSAAKAAIAQMLDALGGKAIISDPAWAKTTITAEISSTNSKRLDTTVTFPLSGNANIINHTQKFGFYLG